MSFRGWMGDDTSIWPSIQVSGLWRNMRRKASRKKQLGGSRDGKRCWQPLQEGPDFPCMCAFIWMAVTRGYIEEMFSFFTRRKNSVVNFTLNTRSKGTWSDSVSLLAGQCWTPCRLTEAHWLKNAPLTYGKDVLCWLRLLMQPLCLSESF